MVSVELIGGLGNQMFQIAACIAYAKRHRLAYHIPLTTANSHSKVPYFTHLANPNWDENLPKSYYTEPNFHYNEIPSVYANGLHHGIHNVIFKGYFQSYKYFMDQEQEVKKVLIFLLRDQAEFYKSMNRFMQVGVHVRRGDYLLYPTKHPVVSDEYLKKAISYFIKLGYHKFMFFSDDISWCKCFVKDYYDPSGLFFEYSEGLPPKTDLFLMGTSAHQIISNSTFAWWAAYLNPNPDKIVIYPENWFGPDYVINDIKDLCPANWIKM